MQIKMNVKAIPHHIRLTCCEIAAVVLVILCGSLDHFIYAWTHVGFTALFSPVNESVWEHLKILFFPALLVSVAEALTVGRQVPGFLPAKTIGILHGMAFIVACFYTYSGIVGRNFLWADILTFVAGVAVSFFSTRSVLVNNRCISRRCLMPSLMVLAAISALFAVFTWFPPHIALFDGRAV